MSTKLSPQPTPFVGRADELGEIAHLLLDNDCRLLTLVGPGGIGKTRLALEAARRFSAPQGIYFVALQPLESPNLIVSAIGEALDLQFFQGDAQLQLLDYLRGKSLLLVLDNFEHLLDGAEQVAEILANAPGAKMIVTSREALNLQEEWLYPVKGLHFPQSDQPTNPEDYGAVRLFAQSALRMRTDFSLADEEAGVVRICALVEGMPLGIELAAAWVRTLSCAEIANEIERSLDILATPARNAPERHRNMRAVLEQSWRLLSDAERDVFKKLSVFRGGFTRQAAQAIAGSSLPVLSALVDKSLLRHEPNERYNIHELLRQYGEEQLNTSPEDSEQARSAHCAYFAAFMKVREDDVKGRRQLGALDEIDADFENISVAWFRGLCQQDGAAIHALMESLFLFCEMRGRLQEGEEFLQQARAAFEKQPGSDLWRRIQTRAAWLWGWSLNSPDLLARIRSQLQDHLSVAQEQGDKALAALCLLVLGELALFTKDQGDSPFLLKQSLSLFTELENRFYMARAADWLGAAYGVNGQRDNLIKFSQQSLDLRRALGDRFGVTQSLVELIDVAILQGQYVRAKQYAQEMSAIYVEMGASAWMLRGSGILAWINFLMGDFQKAELLAENVLRQVGDSAVMAADSGAITHAILSLLAALEEDYAKCQQHSERASAAILGSTRYRGMVPTALAIAACGLGDYPAARGHLVSALKLVSSRQDNRGLVTLLPIAAMILAHDGEQEAAVQLLGLASDLPASARPWMEQMPMFNRLRDTLQAELASEIFDAAWERGNMRDLEIVVDELLARDITSHATSGAIQALTNPLTERELEVLRLLAAGRTNREIAQVLVLAVGTVKWYVSEIFSKLGVASRIEAIARAGELNLLS